MRLENLRKKLTPSKKKYSPRGGQKSSSSGVKRKLQKEEPLLDEATLESKVRSIFY